ncbi:MAG: hypothetical protein R2695_04055 [Acidimicrobiales bacterium]
MTRLAALVVALLAVACTPAQVAHFADANGIDLTPAEAAAIAEWTEQQDCLPGYDRDQYLECGLADAWRHYRLDRFVTLDTFARMGWCESRLTADIVSQYGFLGLLQQHPEYWPARAAAAGWGDDWSNPRINAFVSGWLADRNGGVHDWAASRGWTTSNASPTLSEAVYDRLPAD